LETAPFLKEGLLMRLMIRNGQAILLALAALAVLGVARLAAATEAGALAPGFTAETVDGKRIALADYKGKSAVLLNFYANY